MGYDFKVSPTTQIIETEINFNNKTVDLPGKYKFIDIKYKFLSSNHTLDSNSPRLNVDVIRNAIGQDSKVIILTTNSRYYVYLTDVSISDLYKTKMSNSLNGIVPTQDDIIGGCLRLSFSDKFLSSR